eukprot:TRINITY_DN10051_c0_g2_i2.p1 TRINITY_DN10051_c0_g2~~TRINITY_DN10051_c0_g2_i2.p1  ORF type:complete len:402 (+),score=30.68 TRINITY_DN10051_c0_g2_i2:210-1415(+)
MSKIIFNGIEKNEDGKKGVASKAELSLLVDENPREDFNIQSMGYKSIKKDISKKCTSQSMDDQGHPKLVTKDPLKDEADCNSLSLSGERLVPIKAKRGRPRRAMTGIQIPQLPINFSKFKGKRAGPVLRQVAHPPRFSSEKKSFKCHFCRQRCEKWNILICINYEQCHCACCIKCLQKDWKNEKADRIRKKSLDWVCPPCRGLCHCQRCVRNLAKEFISLDGSFAKGHPGLPKGVSRQNNSASKRDLNQDNLVFLIDRTPSKQTTKRGRKKGSPWKKQKQNNFSNARPGLSRKEPRNNVVPEEEPAPRASPEMQANAGNSLPVSQSRMYSGYDINQYLMLAQQVQQAQQLYYNTISQFNSCVPPYCPNPSSFCLYTPPYQYCSTSYRPFQFQSLHRTQKVC